MTGSNPDERGAHAAADAGLGEPVTTAQRWLASLSLLAALAAIVVLIVGGTKSVGVLICGLVGLALTLAGGWWFLSNRGLVRWLAAAVVVAAPVFVIVFYISRHVLWAVVLLVVLVAVSVAAGRAAMSVPDRPPACRSG